MERIPNATVWNLGREYLEAAEILVEEYKLWPAAVLAALSIEILLKSFLATKDIHGYTSTQHGHALTYLFSKIAANDQAEIITYLCKKESNYDVLASLNQFNQIFTTARYRYEITAMTSVGNDIVIFARHLCDAIFELGNSRGA